MVADELHDAHVGNWRAWWHAQARQFLTRLDPEAEALTFQTFDDTPANRRELARVVHGDFAGVADALACLQQRRAGIFVTVNATDGRGRQAHNIERVRAVFVDLDGAPLAPALKAGLEPHIVVESSPGRFHAYWLTDNCPLDQFGRVQRALARRFNGDPSVHDLPRVMRLPGFRHFKGEAQTTKLLDGIGTTAPPYPLAEIVGGFKLERVWEHAWTSRSTTRKVVTQLAQRCPPPGRGSFSLESHDVDDETDRTREPIATAWPQGVEVRRSSDGGMVRARRTAADKAMPSTGTVVLLISLWRATD